MELYNGKYCASYDDLAGIMSRDQIMRHAERVCRGGNGRAALYAVDTLPIRFKVEVMRRYPDLQAQAEYKEFADAIITDTAAEAYYAEYTLQFSLHPLRLFPHPLQLSKCSCNYNAYPLAHTHPSVS